MFPLGHLGLTLAAFLGLRRVRPGGAADHRLVLLGAVLPDLVDKPLHLLLAVEGRSVAHSLAFQVLLTALALGFLLRRHRLTGARADLLPLAFGSWTHLLLDRMWGQPYALFWPFQGLALRPGVFDPSFLLRALADPWVLGGEVAGAAVLVYVVLHYRLYRRATLARALRSGALGE